MTNHYELTKKYHNHEMITVCCWPGCDMHRINDEWVHYDRQEGYKNYSHGYCPEHYEEAREYNRKLMEKLNI